MSSSPLRELTGVRVVIDQVVYEPSIPGVGERTHTFVYYITIHNGSSEPLTFKGRKWVVQDVLGETIVVEGDGIVGQFPRLEPGESFSYNSAHSVAANAIAQGAYLGLTDSGEAVFTRIPAFELNIPD